MQNGTILQYFHSYYPANGVLWNKISEDAVRLCKMGFTAIWLPPAYKGASGSNSVGYDVYDLYDLGEFDQKNSIMTKYGTHHEFLQAVKNVHKAGMHFYADIVLNHKGGADEKEQVVVKRVNPDNRNEMVGDEFTIEAYTRFTFSGRNNKYSDFIWNQECFSGVDYAADLDESSIFKILNSYGDAWEEGINSERGNFDYLMYADIEFRNIIVREELKKWGLWFWRMTNVSGFRLDAVKHIDYHFYNEWLDTIRHETKEELFAVGEYWAPNDLESMLNYIDNTGGRMSLFDAPLQENFHIASSIGKDFDLRTIFDNTLLQTRPELAVTLVENHDTQPLQALESPVATWFKPLAYALILLREAGYPCVFFPDLFGATYTGKDEEGNEKKIIIDLCPNLENLIHLRKLYSYGLQVDYFKNENLIGWIRKGSEEFKNSGCAVVLSSAEPGSIRMEIGRDFAGKKMSDALSNCQDSVVIDQDGYGDFSTLGGNVSVYITKESNEN